MFILSLKYQCIFFNLISWIHKLVRMKIYTNITIMKFNRIKFVLFIIVKRNWISVFFIFQITLKNQAYSFQVQFFWKQFAIWVACYNYIIWLIMIIVWLQLHVSLVQVMLSFFTISVRKYNIKVCKHTFTDIKHCFFVL